MPVKSWTLAMTETLKITAPFRVAIIIPHFNDTARLEKCLTALMPQTANKRVQIIVVDNDSSEDFTPLKATFPTLIFLTETRKDAAAVRNTGVLASLAENLCFLDADCIPAADWVETALEHCGQDRIVGGKITLFDDTPPPRSGAQAFELAFAFPQETYVKKKRFSVTSNILTARTVFDDTDSFGGQITEATDWCQRAVARGWLIVYRNVTMTGLIREAAARTPMGIFRALSSGQVPSDPDRFDLIDEGEAARVATPSAMRTAEQHEEDRELSGHV
jgi:glycosyltransferase involved in cell wall biosynthesis